MLYDYDCAELSSAILNAFFSAYLTTPFDPEMMKQAIVGEADDDDIISRYQDKRVEFHDGKNLQINNSKFPP